jgi:hypothetical protein
MAVLETLASILPAEVTGADEPQRRFQIEQILATPTDAGPVATVLRRKAGGERSGIASDDAVLEQLYELLEDTFPFLLLPALRFSSGFRSPGAFYNHPAEAARGIGRLRR